MTTKQKNIRDYIIGLCVIGVLIVALIIQGKSTNGEDGTKETIDAVEVDKNEGKTLDGIIAANIKKVTYTLKDKEAVVFEKTSDTWVLNGDEKFPLSVESFQNQFLQKYVEGKVFDEITEYESLAHFGIEDPEATIEVIDNAGNTRTYIIGAYNTVIGAYYMYYKEKDILYTASSEFYFICRENIYDFAAIDNFPTFSTSSLDYMVMNNGEKKVELAYLEDGYDTDPFGSATWYIKSPFNFYRACDQQDVTDNYEELFTGVGFSKKADYYATDEELESYGLIDSDRYYEIVYRNSKDTEEHQERITVRVVFGNYIEEEDSYYARVILTQGIEIDDELSRSINLMKRASADAILNLDPLDYIYPFVLYVPMDEYSGGGLKVTYNDGTVCEVKYDATYDETYSNVPKTEKITLNGAEADLEAFKEFYYEITKIYVNRPLYSTSEIVDCEPTYIVEYDRNVEDFFGDAVVEYREYDATYYQVSINGTVDCLVVRRTVDKAMSMLKEVQ